MKLHICLLIALSLPISGPCADVPVIVDTPEITDAASNPEASSDDFPLFDEADFQEVSDPLEPLNRGIFWFNDKLYFYLAKPVARAYRYAPEPFRVSVNNFFQNLRAPIRIVNAGLQGKFASAGNELTRFFTNTTLGIGGLFDPAKEHFNLKQMDEDTGQTFGHYGIGPGPYLVLPVIGSSNLRDGIGLIGDANLSLVYHLWGRGKDNNDYFAAYTSDRVNELSLDKDTYEGIKKDALDPYLFIRDAYAQYRRTLVDQ
jgi:phospholipid-binding lipoprotein MlaA